MCSRLLLYVFTKTVPICRVGWYYGIIFFIACQEIRDTWIKYDFHRILPSVYSCELLMKQLVKLEFPTNEHTRDRSDSCL